MKKNIPRKNYLIYALITVATIGVCLYLASWYNTIRDYYNDHSVISEVTSEINIDSLSNVLSENPDILVYISSSKDSLVKPFEKQFKKIIVNYNLGDNFIYIDISKEVNESVMNLLLSNYLGNNIESLKKIYYPNIIMFKDGKIFNMLYLNKSTINKNDVTKFLERNGFITND